MNNNNKRAIHRIGMLAMAASLALSTWAGAPSAAASDPAGSTVRETHTVRVDPNEVIQSDFLGIGVNVIPGSLMEGTRRFGYTDMHWEMDKKRILTLQPKVARIWFQIDWMESSKGVYTFDSPEMKAFYKYLDAFKEAGTEIEFNMGWKIGSKAHEWFNIPGVDPWTSAPADLDAYAASTSAVLNELIHNRGYDNVKYLTFYNEPNGSWDFEAPGDQQAYYAEMVRKVSERLAADGLRDSIEIWGPEETGAPGWTRYMKDRIDEHMDGYSFHVYGQAYEGLRGALKERSDYVAPKPVHLTEFGWGDDNMSNWDAGFANSVVAVANGGVKSALVWQLNGVWTHDPAGSVNGSYTMWDSIVLGMTPNKTFYSAGLLNRYIPEHSDVIAVDTGSPDLRAAAFKTADGNYTILLESKAGAPKDVTFDFGGVEIGKTFRKHVYKDDVARTGNAILPPASASFEAGASFRDANVDEAYHFAIYTTAPAQTQVEVSPLTPTIRSGDKLQLTANVIDNAGGVTWSIVGGAGAEGGAINKNTGVYHAPQVNEETLIAVKAASEADPSAYGVALIKVLPKSLPNTVEPVTFGLAPGVYPSAEAVTLTTETPGAEIRYTLDGSEPTTASPLYERPIILADGTLALLKAKAFQDGKNPSATVSALYQTRQVSNSPDGYAFCAYEGGECYFEGEAIVAFGADGLFNYAVHEDGVACSAEQFGGDPSPGHAKRCFVSRDIPEEMPVVTFFNASFEKPGTTSARPGPMTNGWEFNTRAGVQHNAGPFGATPAPLGVQTAYLKTDGGVSGVIGQSINFKPGAYQMEFKAAKRTSFGGTQTFDVYFDDTVIGSYAPTSGAYVTFRTEPFETSGGRHTIRFVATTTVGDNTAFLDDVRMTHPKPFDAPHLANASFESPAATNDARILLGGSASSSGSAGWTFNETSGVARNGASGAPNAPLGVQAAALRSADGEAGRFSQPVEFPAGTYVLSFRAAASGVSGAQTFEVRVGDQVVGTYAPTATSYADFDSDFFTVEAGTHDVSFVSVTADGERTAYVDAVSVERIEIPDWPELVNGGFESPTIATSHGVLGGGDGWTFNERSGMQRNGSAFGAADAPEGTQSALLQTNGGIAGAISQTIVFPAGSYAISFQAAKRTSFGGQQSFAVYLDDQVLGSYTPTSGSYQAYTTDGFVIDKPGRHTIRFAATTTTGDNTAFVDAIDLVPYTPPSGPAIPNGSFESPPVTASTGVQVGGAAEGWTFHSHSGLVKNGSVFGEAPAPSGIQAAYLNTNNGQGEFSQSVFLPGGTYAITFQAAKRSFGGAQSFDVYVDETLVGSYAPASTAYASFATDAFTVETGHHTIRFAATTTTGDNTAFIDAITIGEPAPQAAPVFANAGFESPAVTAVRVNMTEGWTFNATAGVQRNGSAFGAAPAPEGVQTGLIQNKDGAAGEISQTLFFPKGTYTIQFQSARRAFGGQQTIEVRAGDTTIGTFSSASSAEFQTFVTEPFTVSSGSSRTIRFVGTAATGDSTAFLDAVTILKVSEQ
ncbi:chitobiase/beta-hexosaminidase C-terminal domain-containing protein [Paenibacillus sp.]|uniref:chitobiase/beta-hexosaminidase C-terminal domain-containing protein n=1 Tax=Paenibacillus sp. TaxID=58172 RepID=UPI0028122EB8|nr:chitobiase/beta-hexosaminidase C-terminal domain-containing protein [Paenibacillus sp.]